MANRVRVIDGGLQPAEGTESMRKAYLRLKKDRGADARLRAKPLVAAMFPTAESLLVYLNHVHSRDVYARTQEPSARIPDHGHRGMAVPPRLVVPGIHKKTNYAIPQLWQYRPDTLVGMYSRFIHPYILFYDAPGEVDDIYTKTMGIPSVDWTPPLFPDTFADLVGLVVVTPSSDIPTLLGERVATRIAEAFARDRVTLSMGLASLRRANGHTIPVRELSLTDVPYEQEDIMEQVTSNEDEKFLRGICEGLQLDSSQTAIPRTSLGRQLQIRYALKTYVMSVSQCRVYDPRAMARMGTTYKLPKTARGFREFLMAENANRGGAEAIRKQAEEYARLKYHLEYCRDADVRHQMEQELRAAERFNNTYDECIRRRANLCVIEEQVVLWAGAIAKRIEEHRQNHEYTRDDDGGFAVPTRRVFNLCLFDGYENNKFNYMFEVLPEGSLATDDGVTDFMLPDEYAWRLDGIAERVASGGREAILQAAQYPVGGLVTSVTPMRFADVIPREWHIPIFRGILRALLREDEGNRLGVRDHSQGLLQSGATGKGHRITLRAVVATLFINLLAGEGSAYTGSSPGLARVLKVQEDENERLSGLSEFCMELWRTMQEDINTFLNRMDPPDGTVEIIDLGYPARISDIVHIHREHKLARERQGVGGLVRGVRALQRSFVDRVGGVGAQLGATLRGSSVAALAEKLFSRQEV